MPDAPDVFGPWRDRVEAIAPQYYRLFVDWQAIQPDPAEPPNFTIPGDGCMRGKSPCAPFQGIRDILRAVRSQQESGHGFKTMIVLYGVPEWAAAKPSGCERDGTTARSRPITDEGLKAYRALIGSLLDLGDEVGVELPYWSPWNEPNHPAFVSPQRASCDVHSPSLAPGVYTKLARAMKAELDARDGDHELVLGEMAGAKQATPRGSSITEFVRSLPDDVACSSKIWSQHQYARPGVSPAAGPVEELEKALSKRDCTRDARIWVTETGVVGKDAGVTRDRSPEGLKRSCAAMQRYLRRWYLDPKVDVAFQYTFREDPAYPVGLADNRLTRAYPVYDLWRRLARRGEPPTRADCRASAR